MKQYDDLDVLFIPCYVDGLPYASASARIRARWPAKHWLEADVYPRMTMPFGEYDAYIFQKAYLTQFARHAIRSLCVKGKLLAFDMCDADWDQSETHEKRLLSVLPLFDFAVSPTRALQQWLARWIPAEVIPDRLDLAEFRHWHENVPGRPLSLVWFGYSHNLGELDALWPEIEPLMNKHGMRLTILSDELPERWANRTWGLGEVPRFVKWTENGANAEIAKHDVALVPQRNRYKSSNRWTTAFALGVVPVDTGHHLERVIDIDRRRREAELGRRLVEQGSDVRLSVQQWKDLIDKYIARRAADNTHLACVRRRSPPGGKRNGGEA